MNPTPEITSKSYSLIYFRGCPNVELARELLRDVGIGFNEICQDDLPEGHELLQWSSPTLLENGELVFGSRLSGSSKACSIGIPSERSLLDRLFREKT